MPLIRTIQINEGTKIGIWKITEPESWFLPDISLEKPILHPLKRVQHLAGRKLLRVIEPGFPLDCIQILPSGRPCLENMAFEFSISHSGDYVAAVVSRKNRVGIDVEKISEKLRRVAHKFLNEEEYRNMPADLLTYALCWSAKEAVFKWHGNGNVLFRSHISLQPFHYKNRGEIDCFFHKEGEEKKLKLQYRIGEKYVLVWVVE